MSKFLTDDSKFFLECRTCREQYNLSRVENLQQEVLERAKLPSPMRLVDKSGKMNYPGEIGKENERSIAALDFWGIKALKMGFSSEPNRYCGGGFHGMSLTALTWKLGRKDQEKIRKRIEKDPYRYPFAYFEYRMYCPKCDTKVRADQEKCEQCGERIAIPPCSPIY